MKKKYYVVLIVLFFLLGHLPFMCAPFVNLESWYADAAKFVAQGRIVEGAHYLEIVIANPITSVIPIVPFYKIFGISEFTARLFSLVCGFFSIIIVFFIGNRYFSEKIGVLSAFLIALNPIFWLYSGLVYTDVPFALILYLAFLLLFIALERNILWLYILSCLLFGIAFLFKFNLIVFIPIIISISILKIFYDDRKVSEKIRYSFKILVICLISLSVIIVPFVFWTYDYLGHLVAPHFSYLNLNSILSNVLLRYIGFFWGSMAWIGIFTGPLYIFVFRDFFKKNGVKTSFLFFIIIFILCLFLASFIYKLPRMMELNLGWFEYLFGGVWLSIARAGLLFLGFTVFLGMIGWGREGTIINKYCMIWFVLVIMQHSFIGIAQRYLVFILPPLYYYLSSLIIIVLKDRNKLRLINYSILMFSLMLFCFLSLFNSYYFASEGYAAAKIAYYINDNNLKDVEVDPRSCGVAAHSYYLMNKNLIYSAVNNEKKPKYLLKTISGNGKLNDTIKNFEVKCFGITIKRYAIAKY